MSITRTAQCGFLSFLALTSCFLLVHTQESPLDDLHTTGEPFHHVESSSSKSSSEAPNTPTAELETQPAQTTLKPAETTLNLHTESPENPTPSASTVKTIQTTPEDVPESTSLRETSPVATTATSGIPSDFTTRQSETTSSEGLVTSAWTVSTEHMTTSEHMTTKATNPPTTTSQAQTTERSTTASPEDTTTIQVSTQTSRETFTTQVTTSKFHQSTSEEPKTRQEEIFTSTSRTNVTHSAVVIEDKATVQMGWLSIVVLLIVIIIASCLAVILFIRRRRRKSHRFGYTNGQRSKMRKGAGGQDAWAGPVNMEAGDDCDAEDQGNPSTDDTIADENETVLITFAAFQSSDGYTGPVGGDGTKEAERWEEQEPLLYIDEDVEEANVRKAMIETEITRDENDSLNVNGGQTFCLTTAV